MFRFPADRWTKKTALFAGSPSSPAISSPKGTTLAVTQETLKEVLACAIAEGQVPVKFNHGSGVENIGGYLENFSLAGDKVRGDWHLLKTHREYEATLEKAEVMPGCLGLSVAFKGKGVAVAGGGKRAKCERLLAADCVTQPAANPDGLFSAKVDTAANDIMPPITTPLVTEPSIADVLTAINKQNEAIAALTQKVDAQEALLQGPGEQPTLAELDQMTDDALAKIGITRAEVDAAIVEADAAEAAETAAAAAGTATPAPAAGTGAVAASAEFKALQNTVIQLQKKIGRDEAAAETQQIETAFAVIDAKIVELSAKNEELVGQNTLFAADNEALRFAVKTGSKPVGAGFEEVTVFTAKDAKPGTFEQIVTNEFDRLMKVAGTKELTAKSQAISFGVKRHQEAYKDYRSRGGKFEFAKK